MKLLNGLALAGLVGVATAAKSDSAEVYILSKSSTSQISNSIAPQLPRQVARHVLIQRLSGETQMNDLPEAISQDDALSSIARYGKVPLPLFEDASVSEDITPSQLVIMLEGITEENAKSLRKDLQAPTFVIPDAPSAKANKHLVDVDLMGVSGACDIAAAVNPYDKCWKGLSLVVKYDAAKNSKIISSLTENLPAIRDAVAANTLEATILLMPESTRSSKHAQWISNDPSELRRRVETPITDFNSKIVVSDEAPDDLVSSASVFAGSETTKMNLGCFTSYNSCVTATNNCTGHGLCRDKYADSTSDGQPAGDKQCFMCHCLPTLAHPDKDDGEENHWGGAYCQKIDISSPFWLLAGTSILLVGIVAGCIGMLFSVGEEKLPGVIGAGVSRSK